MRMTPCLLLLPGLGFCTLGAEPSARETWQSLLRDSPFQQPMASIPVEPSGELEFRGVVQEGDQIFVSLFDPAAQISQWIAVPGRWAGHEVTSYDAGAGTVALRRRGQDMSLRLKVGRVRGIEPQALGSASKSGQDSSTAGLDADRHVPDDIRSLPAELREAFLQRRRMRNVRPSLETRLEAEISAARKQRGSTLSVQP